MIKNYQETLLKFEFRKERPRVNKIKKLNVSDIPREEKRRMFTETFRLIKKLKSLNENITLYFFLISLYEDRINTLWSYNYWKEYRKFEGDRPDIDTIQKYTFVTRINNLFHSHVFKELNFTEKLIEIYYERNIRVHQTIWSRDNFSKKENEVLEKVIRKLDKIKRDMLKQPEYSKHLSLHTKKNSK